MYSHTVFKKLNLAFKENYTATLLLRFVFCAKTIAYVVAIICLQHQRRPKRNLVRTIALFLVKQDSMATLGATKEDGSATNTKTLVVHPLPSK